MQHRRPRNLALTGILAVVGVLFAGILVAPGAVAATKTFKPVDARGKVIAFKPRGVDPATIRKARMHMKHRRRGKLERRVGAVRVRHAVANGRVLRVRVPKRSRHEKLRVSLHKREKGGPHGGPPPSSCTLGTFGPNSMPGACWRPYADSSPFNRPVPAEPRLLSNSQAIVQRLVGWGKAQNMLAGNSKTPDDYYHPIYYAQPSDPLYTVQCTQWVSSCEVHGTQVRIPAAAKPASASDGHLAVVDQQSGVEYDFWQVAAKPADGGVLKVSHGGATQIDGDGLGSAATAAKFGLAAGVIRGEEMLAGEINHALFTVIKCSSGQTVYPAAPKTTGATCSRFGLSNADAPPMGARLWLAMSDAQIEALAVPAWKKTLLHAMADYGMLIGDTMNGNGAWAIQPESGASYTSFGATDPWETVAQQAQAPTYDGSFVFDVNSGVDWGRYLRVLDPCVSQGGC